MAGRGRDASRPGLLPQCDRQAWSPWWEVGAGRCSSQAGVAAGHSGQGCRTQLSTHRPTVQKRGKRGGGSCGPQETGHGARPVGSARPGCRSLPFKRVGHGPIHPSVEGSGCVHPAVSWALLPRYLAQAWSLLEAARDQGPKGPASPTACTQWWSVHDEEGRRSPSQLRGCFLVSL